MWKYHYTPNVNEIYHAAIGVTRSNRANHKYIDRYKSKNGKWVYVYPEDAASGQDKGIIQDKNEQGGDSKSVHSFFEKGDPDFEKAYGMDRQESENYRLGNTDFFGFKRDDGTYYIISEDEKWVLPKGVVITKDLVRRLEEFENSDFIPNDWSKLATDIIDSSAQHEQSKKKRRK